MPSIRRSRRPALGVATVASVVAVVLTSCSDNSTPRGDESDNRATPARPSELSNVHDIPEVTMIDEQDPWPRYTTAKITGLQPGAGGKTITVNYASGPDVCSGLAGYAVHRADGDAEVTVITGMRKSCTGDDTHRTTVLPLSEPLGELTPEVSKYSESAIRIS